MANKRRRDMISISDHEFFKDLKVKAIREGISIEDILKNIIPIDQQDKTVHFNKAFKQLEIEFKILDEGKSNANTEDLFELIHDLLIDALDGRLESLEIGYNCDIKKPQIDNSE